MKITPNNARQIKRLNDEAPEPSDESVQAMECHMEATNHIYEWPDCIRDCEPGSCVCDNSGDES